MPLVPGGNLHHGDLESVVKEAGALLGPNVVHLAYRIGPDSTDAPSIFFRILLADTAVREETITAVTRQISSTLMDTIRPLDNWRLRPYFNFRSKSEQDRHRDPDWE
jgi:hypothetical protein